MKMNEFQDLAGTTRLATAGPLYAIVGLPGEVGELCSLVAKAMRDGFETEEAEEKYNRLLKKELGDILWFVAAIATDHDFELEDVAAGVVAKLRSRKERGVIGGSGDER